MTSFIVVNEQQNTSANDKKSTEWILNIEWFQIATLIKPNDKVHFSNAYIHVIQFSLHKCMSKKHAIKI